MALAFAGQALAQDEVTFGTNWVAEAEHGGFYQAVADGTYEKYGLKVHDHRRRPTRRCCSAARSSSTWRATCSARSRAVEQDVPVIEVAAIFQKDPQIIMAHPEAGLEEVRRPRQAAKSIFIGDDLFVTGYQWMKAAYPGFNDEQRKPYNYNSRAFLADKESASRATSPPSPSRSRRKAASSRRSS